MSLLESYFDCFYAKEISSKMNSVFKTKCFGCQNSCLSQTDHTCINLTREQQLKLYFEDVLREVDESDILMKWKEAASALDVSSELLEMYKLKIYCIDFRDSDMKSFMWRNKMIKMTIQVLLLETRLN